MAKDILGNNHRSTDEHCQYDPPATSNTLISLVLLLIGWITFEWSEFGSINHFSSSSILIICFILLVALSIYSWFQQNKSGDLLKKSNECPNQTKIGSVKQRIGETGINSPLGRRQSRNLEYQDKTERYDRQTDKPKQLNFLCSQIAVEKIEQQVRQHEDCREKPEPQRPEKYSYSATSNDKKGEIGSTQVQNEFHNNQVEPELLRQPVELSKNEDEKRDEIQSPPQALLGINPCIQSTALRSPTLILDPSQTYSRLDSGPAGGEGSLLTTRSHGFSYLKEPFPYLNSATSTNIHERLNLNDFYVFHVPVGELVRYFTIPENRKSLPSFYNKVLDNINVISAPVAADLIRLPVKTNFNNPDFTHALCARILQFPANVRNLTSMQIALVCWSLAKTPQTVTTGKRQGEFNCTAILNSLADEALCRAKEFEPLSIANMLWACGKLRYKHDQLLTQLANVAAGQLELFNSQNIANTYWALGTLEANFTSLTPRMGNGQLAAVVVGTLVQKIPGFNSQAVANFVWACARLQWNVPVLLQSACQVAMQTNSGFKPQEIANFMWGVAKLGYTNGIFAIEVFAKRAAANLRLFNSQEVSNAYWSLGTLELRGTALTPISLSAPVVVQQSGTNFSPTPIGSTTTSSVALPSRSASTIELLGGRSFSGTPSTQESLTDKHQQQQQIEHQSSPHGLERQPHENELLDVLLHKMDHFNSQAIANFIWACGKLQWKSLELCAAFRVIIQQNVSYFRPQNTANILWAFAKLRVNDTELNRILIDAAVKHLDDFNTQEIANVYWAIGTLEVQGSPLTPGVRDFHQIAEEQRQSPVCRTIMEKLPNFKPQEIANFLWACARLRWRPSDVLNVATDVTLRCAGRFKPQEVGNLVWALAKLNYRHVELLNTMCNYAALNIHHFTPQNVANIYWAIGSLTFSQTLLSNDHPTPEFLNSLIQLITMFNDQEITNFLWSCGRLRWEIKEVISVVSQIVIRKARFFRRKELLNLQWAFKKLGHHDLVEILDDAMNQESPHHSSHPNISKCFSLATQGYAIKDVN